MLRRLRLRYNRWVCRNVGHDLTYPRPVTSNGLLRASMFETNCRRCPFGTVGDAIEMEKMGAW